MHTQQEATSNKIPMEVILLSSCRHS